MPGGSTAEIRRANANRLRRTMLSDSVWTREALATTTGLSPATCRNLLLELLAAGEVTELALADPCGGRPARRFRYDPKSHLFALVQIKYDELRHSIRVLITDLAGGVVADTEEFPDLITPEILLDTVARLTAGHPRLAFIAVSYPGVILNGKTDRWSDVEELSGLDLGALLRRRFAVPSVLDNDVNLAACGYAAQHMAPDANIAYIGFPKGNLPGCGLIVDGRLLRGTHGFAGELLYIRNESFEQQRARLREPGGMAQTILVMLRAITALLDPERIVISGEDISPEDCDYIRRQCRSMVRGELLPELVFARTYPEDNLRGLREFAWNRLFGDSDGFSSGGGPTSG